MTAMNMPVMFGATAQKPVAPAGEKRLPGEGSNNSFYKQLKQMNQKQINLSEKRNTGAMDRDSRTGQKPGKPEVKVEDKPADKSNNQVIDTGKPDSQGVPNPEEMAKSQVKGDCPEETAPDKTDMVAVTEVLGPIFQLVSFVTSEALPEPVNVQPTDNPEPVITTVITATNPANDELLLSEVTVSDQEESRYLQVSTPIQGSDESELPIKDAKATASDPGQQLTNNSNSNGSVAATEEQPTSTAPTLVSAAQTDNQENGNSSSGVARDGIPANAATAGISDSTDKNMEAYVKAGEKTKAQINPGQMAATADRATKEAPEVKSWVKELLPDQSGKQKLQSESGTEGKQNNDRDSAATSKTSPSTDVKKLINFETHRLNASRLTSEPASPEGQAKTVSDDGKSLLNVLSRSDTEILKTTANLSGTDSSKSLPTAREVIAQIVQKAELLSTNKLSEVRIELKPEFLGRLTIKVMVEEGVVTARFIAENQQVKHMLESNLNTLRQNLESQGIRVERAEVSVQLNNGGMFDGSEGSRQYLWEEGQFSENHQREGPYEGNYYTGGYEELDPNLAQAGEEHGYNENGSLNFLI